jgi:hypothetical protein
MSKRETKFEKKGGLLREIKRKEGDSGKLGERKETGGTRGRQREVQYRRKRRVRETE